MTGRTNAVSGGGLKSAELRFFMQNTLTTQVGVYLTNKSFVIAATHGDIVSTHGYLLYLIPNEDGFVEVGTEYGDGTITAVKRGSEEISVTNIMGASQIIGFSFLVSTPSDQSYYTVYYS